MKRLSVAFLVVSLVGCSSAPEVPGDERATAVDQYFEDLAEAGRFSGVVLVAEGGVVALESGYGWADVENEIPNVTDTIMRIGSLTKPVTASAALIAAGSDRLSLDDRVCDSIDGCPSSWSPVTFRHLLTHTSGVPDLFGDLEEVPVESTAAELARVLSTLDPDAALSSTPGDEYAYSNFNYVLLGVGLEKVYDSRWEDILAQTVFAPLGLRDTAYDDVWSLVPRRARGYGRHADGALRNIEYDDHAAYAAGGLRSTTGDLLTWSQSVFSGALLGDELTGESFTPVKGNYGFGWQICEFFDRRIYNHTGGIDGFSSHIAHYPDEALTVIVLSNVEADSAILSACDLAALWFGWRDAPAETDGWLELEPRDRCGLAPSG